VTRITDSVLGFRLPEPIVEAVREGVWEQILEGAPLEFAVSKGASAKVQLKLLLPGEMERTTLAFREIDLERLGPVLGLGRKEGGHLAPGVCDVDTSIVFASSFSDYHWRLDYSDPGSGEPRVLAPVRESDKRGWRWTVLVDSVGELMIALGFGEVR
jgi:hypothetical protein